MPEPLKNMFNQRFFDVLIASFQSVYPSFDGGIFLAHVYDENWETRELKGRMRHITLALREVLPGGYRDALAMLREVAPRLHGFGFETMVFPDFVEAYGLDDWEASIPALEQFTQQSSAEFAVRPFILKDPERMMAQMRTWAKHGSHHVRRLASEGCRPRLPWGIALPIFKADPSPILPILETLKQDESEFVRRSVANNLNDIAKDNPQVVLDTLRRWQAIETPEMRSMISHALRTLVKKGDPAALELIGYSGDGAFVVKDLSVEPAVIPLGGETTICFTVESCSESPQQLVIDYVVHLMRSNGQQTPKVFKLTKAQLLPGETLMLSKRHSFRPVTTRRYYPGKHAVEIQINGKRSERREFLLGT